MDINAKLRRFTAVSAAMLYLSMVGCSSMAAAKAAGDPDKMFMVETAYNSNAEVELGRVASERAQNPQVRQFAQQMVRDHQQGNQQLMRIAKQEDVTLPREADPMCKQVKAHLNRVPDQQFDQEYMSRMIASHQRALAMMEDKASDAQSQEVRSFAREQARVIGHHLQEAKAINQLIETQQSSRLETR